MFHTKHHCTFYTIMYLFLLVSLLVCLLVSLAFYCTSRGTNNDNNINQNKTKKYKFDDRHHFLCRYYLNLLQLLHTPLGGAVSIIVSSPSRRKHRRNRPNCHPVLASEALWDMSLYAWFVCQCHV